MRQNPGAILIHTHTHTHSYWVIHQGDISRSSVQAYSAFQRPGSLSWNNVSLVATAEVRSYGVGVNEEHKVAQRWNVEPACKPILNIIIELNISNVCVISQIKWLECGFFVHWVFFFGLFYTSLSCFSTWTAMHLCWALFIFSYLFPVCLLCLVNWKPYILTQASCVSMCIFYRDIERPLSHSWELAEWSMRTH